MNTSPSRVYLRWGLKEPLSAPSSFLPAQLSCWPARPSPYVQKRRLFDAQEGGLKTKSRESPREGFSGVLWVPASRGCLTDVNFWNTCPGFIVKLWARIAWSYLMFVPWGSSVTLKRAMWPIVGCQRKNSELIQTLSFCECPKPQVRPDVS